MKDIGQMPKAFKAAVATDDGVTISSHFGRAKYFEVIEIESGEVKKRDQRDKAGHHSMTAHHDHHRAETRTHGFDAASQTMHSSMADSIRDCQFVLARGMGNGAYQSMVQYNIRPIVTELKTIDEAIKALLEGTITDHVELLH